VQEGKKEPAVNPLRGESPLIPSARAATVLSGRQLFRRTTREIIHKFLTEKRGVYTKVAMEFRCICDVANMDCVKSKKRKKKRQCCGFIKDGLRGGATIAGMAIPLLMLRLRQKRLLYLIEQSNGPRDWLRSLAI
jgi:hypothetical protein